MKTAKNNKNEAIETNNLHGKTNDELKEILQNIEVQISQVNNQVSEAQTAVNNGQAMLLKLQGAKEIVSSMLPKEKEDEAKNINRAD